MFCHTETEKYLTGIILEYCRLDFSTTSSCLKMSYLIVDDRDKYDNENVHILYQLWYEIRVRRT